MARQIVRLLACIQTVAAERHREESTALFLLQTKAAILKGQGANVSSDDYVITVAEGVKCGDCGPSNDLLIGRDGRRFDVATRTNALEVCGPVCRKNVDCAGFQFVESHGKCVYRKSITCQKSADHDRNCYIKEAKNATEDAGSLSGNSSKANTSALAPSNVSELACDAYMREAGCGWTSRWSCPGQKLGTLGLAGKKNGRATLGFSCCCEMALWKSSFLDANSSNKATSTSDNRGEKGAQMRDSISSSGGGTGAGASKDKNASSTQIDGYGSNKGNSTSMPLAERSSGASVLSHTVENASEGNKSHRDNVTGVLLDGRGSNSTSTNVSDWIQGLSAEAEINPDEHSIAAGLASKMKSVDDVLKLSAGNPSMSNSSNADRAATVSTSAILNVSAQRTSIPASNSASFAGALKASLEIVNEASGAGTSQFGDNRAQLQTKEWNTSYHDSTSAFDTASQLGNARTQVSVGTLDLSGSARVDNKTKYPANDSQSIQRAHADAEAPDGHGVWGAIEFQTTQDDEAAERVRRTVLDSPVQGVLANGKTKNIVQDSISAREISSVGSPGELMALGLAKTQSLGSDAAAGVLRRLGDARNATFLLPTAGDKGQALGWPGPFPGSDVVALNGAPEHQADVICELGVLDAPLMRGYLREKSLLLAVVERPAAHLPSDKSEAANRSVKHGELHRSCLPNPQAHDLGWYARVGGSQLFDQDVEAINSWLQDLQGELDLVIPADRLEEGLVLLRQQLGADNVDIAEMAFLEPHIEAALGEPQGELDTSVDSALYEYFSKVFDESWREAGGRLQSEVDTLRSLNAAMEQGCQTEGDKAELCPWSFRATAVEFVDRLRMKQFEIL